MLNKIRENYKYLNLIEIKSKISEKISKIVGKIAGVSSTISGNF